MENLFEKYIRSYAKISKENLKKYISYFDKSTNTSDDLIDEDPNCVSCEYRFKDKLKDSNCIKCSYNNVIASNKPKQYRLSKSQLIQMIAYHFLPLSSDGSIEFVSENYIAHLVGSIKSNSKKCDKEKVAACLKTVARNNEKLSELGLIQYEKVESGIFSLKINNYSDAFISKENGGKGFIPMPLNFFKKFRKCKSVNDMRLAIEAYEIYYSSAYQHEDEYMHQRILSRFKNVVSKNSSHRKAIFNLFSNLTDIFTVEQIKLNKDDKKTSKLIQFKVNKEYRCNNYDKLCMEETTEKVCDITDEINLKLPAETLDDVIAMGIEYGIKVIEKALNEFNSLKNKSETKNIGGFIRGLIKQDYYTFVFSDLM